MSELARDVFEPADSSVPLRELRRPTASYIAGIDVAFEENPLDPLASRAFLLLISLEGNVEIYDIRPPANLGLYSA